MKAIGVGFILFLIMAFASAPGDRGVLIHRFIVQPSSKLTINGKTNVNSFQCGITHYFGNDTLVLQEGRNRRPVFTKGYVGLEAASFDCGMQVMTNDFGKTIKSKQYPFISIEFISFERGTNYESSNGKFKGKLKISLGGVTKAFEMDCTIQAKQSGMIHLQGGRDFKFSDFDLEPPTKMMGMVKVQDELTVNFHLVLLLDRNS